MDSEDNISTDKEEPWWGYRAKINVKYSLPRDIIVQDAICLKCGHSISDMANWGADIDKCLNGENHYFK